MPFPKLISISLRLQVNKMSNTELELCSSCYYIKCYRIWRLQPQWRSNTFQCKTEEHCLEATRKLNNLATVNTKGSAGGGAFGYITELTCKRGQLCVSLPKQADEKQVEGCTIQAQCRCHQHDTKCGFLPHNPLFDTASYWQACLLLSAAVLLLS